MENQLGEYARRVETIADAATDGKITYLEAMRNYYLLAEEMRNKATAQREAVTA